jgi:hypothetical protein
VILESLQQLRYLRLQGLRNQRPGAVSQQFSQFISTGLSTGKGNHVILSHSGVSPWLI